MGKKLNQQLTIFEKKIQGLKTNYQRFLKNISEQTFQGQKCRLIVDFLEFF